MCRPSHATKHCPQNDDQDGAEHFQFLLVTWEAGTGGSWSDFLSAVAAADFCCSHFPTFSKVDENPALCRSSPLELAIFGFIIVVALYFGQAVLVPFAFAVILSFILASPAPDQVQVEWRFERTAREPLRHVVSWTERGGPSIKPPEQTGFGHIVIQRVAAQARNATVSYEFPEHGVAGR